jgi:hypothetical protein
MLLGNLDRVVDTKVPVVLTILYVAVATSVHLLIVVLAGALEPFLNDAKRELIARRSLSLLLALVATWFALSTAR